MNGKAVHGKRLKTSLKKTPEECLKMQVDKLMEIADANRPFDPLQDCTLFVFHLPSDWDDSMLKETFAQFGNCTSAMVAKKKSGASRGYGFVTFDNPKTAALAIQRMNSQPVGADRKKRLKVQLKHPPAPRPGCTIFVFHLPNEWSESHLQYHFNNFGPVVSATVKRHMGSSKGFGFVTFQYPESARQAILYMNGYQVGNKRLKVSMKKGEEPLYNNYNMVPLPGRAAVPPGFYHSRPSPFYADQHPYSPPPMPPTFGNPMPPSFPGYPTSYPGFPAPWSGHMAGLGFDAPGISSEEYFASLPRPV
eukprot:GHVU01156976.1.p1 GENE.GHVU01156976.1~~GHVU01156976.1.p1  ORF type:complete len:306 (-),score=41.80 GHVU01156976.1:107-1024(-)